VAEVATHYIEVETHAEMLNFTASAGVPNARNRSQ